MPNPNKLMQRNATTCLCGFMESLLYQITLKPRTTIRTQISPVLPGPADTKSIPRNMLRLTCRTGRVIIWLHRVHAKIRMIGHVGFQAMIDTLEQNDVAAIVPAHHGPGFGIALHTTRPQIETGMHQLLAEAERRSEITKLVAVEMEMAASDLKSVDGLVG